MLFVSRPIVLSLLAAFVAVAVAISVGTGQHESVANQLQNPLPDLVKRMDPDSRDWAQFDRIIRGPDPSLQPASSTAVLRERYGHLVHHNGMPVFEAGSARNPSQAQLMKQAWADFGTLQVYGSHRDPSRGLFQAQSLLASGSTYTYHRLTNADELLRQLNHFHQLEVKYGPNLKPVLMGLPFDTRGMGRFGGHSANRVWAAPKESLSNYDIGSLRHKLNRDRFGLFISRNGEHLLAITVGNNGVAQIEERLNEAAPLFVAGSRRF